MLASISRLGLGITELILSTRGEERPSDNLGDCIRRLARGRKPSEGGKTIEGLNVLPQAIEQYLDTARVLSNIVNILAQDCQQNLMVQAVKALRDITFDEPRCTIPRTVNLR